MEKKTNECVNVVLRCMPVRTDPPHTIKVVETDIAKGAIIIKKPNGTSETFHFAAVYDEQATQEEVYINSALPIVESVVEGYNGTIIAYGHCGSGKTYTMEGAYEDQKTIGIIPRSFDTIFSKIKDSDECRHIVKASYIEIDKEEVKDLLKLKSTDKVTTYEDAKLGVCFKGLKEVTVHSAADLIKLHNIGKAKRKKDFTRMNPICSATHTIFMITIETIRLSAEPTLTQGRLIMVDLLGIERAGHYTSEARLSGVTKANLALGTLNRVITGLAKKNSTHIPYKESKVTIILKNSLSGNARTLMVATIKPVNRNYDDTIQTLKYATEARLINNTPRINILPVNTGDLILSLENELKELKIKSKCNPKIGVEESKEKPIKLSEQIAEETRRLEKQLDKLKSSSLKEIQDISTSSVKEAKKDSSLKNDK